MATFDTFELIRTFPRFAEFTQDVELGGERWSIRFVWRHRLRAWFIDIADADGTSVVRGKRVSPNSNATFGRLDFPGAILALGDDSERRNLGRDLLVAYVELED